MERHKHTHIYCNGNCLVCNPLGGGDMSWHLTGDYEGGGYGYLIKHGAGGAEQGLLGCQSERGGADRGP
jgi:hypothetical protein